MTISLTLQGQYFLIKSARAGEVKSFPYTSDNTPHDRWKITVYPQGRKSFSFYFYTSYNDYLNRKPLDAAGLHMAFYSFMTDVAAAAASYSDFANEFGYDPDDKYTKQVYRAVKSAEDKWNRAPLGDVNDMIADFTEKFSDLV